MNVLSVKLSYGMNKDIKMANNNHYLEGNYYDEGDLCPACKKDIVVWVMESDTGLTSLKCQECNYDVTDILKDDIEE